MYQWNRIIDVIHLYWPSSVCVAERMFAFDMTFKVAFLEGHKFTIRTSQLWFFAAVQFLMRVQRRITIVAATAFLATVYLRTGSIMVFAHRMRQHQMLFVIDEIVVVIVVEVWNERSKTNIKSLKIFPCIYQIFCVCITITRSSMKFDCFVLWFLYIYIIHRLRNWGHKYSIIISELETIM